MDPNRIAIDYYFGDLQYWKLPAIAADALDRGFDGPALRQLAGVNNLTLADFDFNIVDSAFREMGVDAPIPSDRARLELAAESAAKALDGRSNVFDEATHIRIRLCHLGEPPQCLKQIVRLSNASRSASRSEWPHLEAELTEAFREFLKLNVRTDGC
jgi:hypothetical protein